MAMNLPSRTRLTSRRRGVALLLVLAMIILIVPIAVGFTQRAGLADFEQRLSVQERVANSVRAQVEAGPLRIWLAEESGRVVIDLEAKTPRVGVLDERWQFDDCRYEIRITAWDQCGMAPWSALTAGSPLRAVIPGGILERLDLAESISQRSKPAGLDQFGIDPFTLDHSALRSAFPSPDEEDGLSIGAWIATHPVSESGSINVNTAPLLLVESAMAVAGRGGIEAIIAARREGRRAPLPGAVEDADGGAAPGRAPRLVGASSSWAVRIDVRVGAAQRSWWVVYQQISGRWECVQRCVIPD